LEKHLRIHYPNLRIADSLFPEFDSYDFQAIGHRNYTRVVRELSALQNRLYDCTKFERVMRYGCANFFFLVLTGEVFDEAEIPVGWGALVESGESLVLARSPAWQEIGRDHSLTILHRIAATGTRNLMRQLGVIDTSSVGSSSADATRFAHGLTSETSSLRLNPTLNAPAPNYPKT
jgi:hypothetical protein